MTNRILLHLAAAAVTAAAAFAEDPAPFRIERLAEGVYAALQPEAQRFNDSNSVIIDTGLELVVVDSQADVSSVENLVGWIRESLQDGSERPLRYLINTHWHGDHTQGNQVYRRTFGEGLRILGHQTLAEDVPQRAAAYLEEEIAKLEAAIPEAEAELEAGVDGAGMKLSEERRQQLVAGIPQARRRLDAYRETRFLPPDVTYGDRLVLHRPGRNVELLHFRAHSRGDTVVYLPQDRILITGDLLDDLPYGGHGYPGEWIEALETLERLDFDLQVPGHGEVRRGKEHLRLVLALLRSLVEQTRAAVAAGKDLPQTRAAVDLGRFRELLAGEDPSAQRAFDAWMPETVGRAFAEARGQDPDAADAP